MTHESSTAIPRDHLADMTRERDKWRREAHVWLALTVMWCVTAAAPYIERAWTEWRAEKPKVSAQVQCVPLIMTTQPIDRSTVRVTPLPGYWSTP